MGPRHQAFAKRCPNTVHWAASLDTELLSLVWGPRRVGKGTSPTPEPTHECPQDLDGFPPSPNHPQCPQLKTEPRWAPGSHWLMGALDEFQTMWTVSINLPVRV